LKRKSQGHVNSTIQVDKATGLSVTINRNPPSAAYLPFTDVFKGFEKVLAVRQVFGNKTDEVLEKLQIGLIPFRYMYMGVRDHDGNLAVGTYHLRDGDRRTLYLDIVHELFHVGQFMQDKAWFGREHRKYLTGSFDVALYYRSPIEIPAYAHAIAEAKRIGMAYEEIVDYLKIVPVIDSKVFSEFLDAVKLSPRMKRKRKRKILVRINRKVSTPFYKFTDYFFGFENLPSVKSLFGESTGRILNGL
jgi:hypothetical protein